MNAIERRVHALEDMVPSLDAPDVIFIVGLEPDFDPTAATVFPRSEPINRLPGEEAAVFKDRVASLARSSSPATRSCALVFLTQSKGTK